MADLTAQASMTTDTSIPSTRQHSIACRSATDAAITPSQCTCDYYRTSTPSTPHVHDGEFCQPCVDHGAAQLQAADATVARLRQIVVAFRTWWRVGHDPIGTVKNGTCEMKGCMGEHPHPREFDIEAALNSTAEDNKEAVERPKALKIAAANDELPPRIVVGANGAYWRDFGDFYSMCPVSEDNDSVTVVAAYVRAPSKSEAGEPE